MVPCRLSYIIKSINAENLYVGVFTRLETNEKLNVYIFVIEFNNIKILMLPLVI